MSLDSLRKEEQRVRRGMDNVGTEERRAAWAKREVYQMYGEYLDNLTKPYPKELLDKHRALQTQKEHEK